jgi:hypothetical protein
MLEESARVETKNYHGERCCHKAAALRVMAQAKFGSSRASKVIS